MLMALVKGKLSRQQENMEDILTSNVFGLLKYAPPSEGILPFLAKARTRDEQRPLVGLSADCQVKYEFWPSLADSTGARCEPDLLLMIRAPDAATYRVLVEAKYLSGKSSYTDEESEVPVDQLARQWDTLTCNLAVDINPVLIYLTANVGMPRADIKEAIADFQRNYPKQPAPVIAWLSWRHLHELAETASLEILRDLKAMLERLGLHFYRGTGQAPRFPDTVWRFRRARRPFCWAVGNTSAFTAWEFKR